MSSRRPAQVARTGALLGALLLTAALGLVTLADPPAQAESLPGSMSQRNTSAAESTPTNRPRSIEYPFTLIQIHMKPNGTGEGKLALATKITADPDTKMIEIEDWEHQPISLTDVKSEPKH